jgi:hypothetical protein
MQIRNPSKKNLVRPVPTFSVLAVVRQGRVRAFVLYQLTGGEGNNVCLMLDNTVTGPSLFKLQRILIKFFVYPKPQSPISDSFQAYQASIVFCTSYKLKAIKQQ